MYWWIAIETSVSDACVCVYGSAHLQSAETQRLGLFALGIVSCCFGFCLDASERHLVLLCPRA